MSKETPRYHSSKVRVAYELGRKHFNYGNAGSANPYPRSDPCHNAWARGWITRYNEVVTLMGKRGPHEKAEGEHKWRAMQQGYDAYAKGVNLDDNPYPKGNLLRQPWSQGWVQRRTIENGHGYKGMKTNTTD